MPRDDNTQPQRLAREDYINRANTATWMFRLQIHPVYTVAYEQAEYQQFLATGTHEVDPEGAWPQRIQAGIEVGGGIDRVYVIEPPLTDYQRYVFQAYHHYAEQGEGLWILDTTRTANPGLPDYDFMLLDDETVIKLHYSLDNGTPLGPELLPPSVLADHLRYKELALAHSTPFLEYEKTLDT